MAAPLAAEDAGPEEDPGFALLAGFAKVKRLYAGVASRLLGTAADTRPRRARSPLPRNPWIAERTVAYPPSRRTQTRVTGLIWRSFHEPDGRVGSEPALRQLLHQSVRLCVAGR